MEVDIIILGAGASGLVAAIAAARKGSSVLVIEQKEKAGKKILATGNGKCNFTNKFQSPECYRTNDSAFVMKVLSNFDVNQTIHFFKELGIYPKERNGYLYPNSEQAASVVEVLLMECRRLKVVFAFGEKVIKIEKPNYTVMTEVMVDQTTKRYFARKLILAMGGCASPKLGSDGSGFQFAKGFGHTLIKPLPALVQLKASDKFCKTLSGVRTNASVTAVEQGTILACESGEIIFTDYGISGIPIMQLSRFVARALDKKNRSQATQTKRNIINKKIDLLLDFLPEFSYEEISEMLHRRVQTNSEKSIEEMLVGLFNHKLSYIMILEAKLNPYDCAISLSSKEINNLTKQIKEFTMTIIDTNSFDHAQVCSGGVSVMEVDENSMESKLVKNLFLAGELLDVDGTCGGYNLQWAWSSGYLAGTSAGSRK